MNSVPAIAGLSSLGKSVLLRGAVLCLCLAPLCVAQTQPESTSTPQNGASATSPEMASHDEATTFKVNVRLVLVRVVVRDQQGHAVGTLRKEDFQLFDNRKAQAITQFSVEQPGSQIAREQKTTETQPGETSAAGTPNIPERYIAYLFDDIHLQMQDLMVVRKAADERLDAMQPHDRAAIFTTSGQHGIEFTDDRAKLHQAVLGIRPTPLAASGVQDCPYMSYYMADMIVNKNDQQVLGDATHDALQCSGLAQSATPQTYAQAVQASQMMAQTAAERELGLGDSETHMVLASIKDVMRRMAAVPGQRNVVLISPGFITPEFESEVGDVIDHAIRSNIVVSTVDARGLYVPPAVADISRANMPNVATSPTESVYDSLEASANDEVLSALADATGGTFFHNSNDLEGGLKQAAETPEYYYVLGFSPQNLKYDGRFHTVNVKLANSGKLMVQARKGYYAPKQAPNAAEEAKQEIQEAIFSQEEMHDLPVELHTQFFKASDADAKLSVLVHVDVKRIHFQKAEGRNNDNLTIAAALFDRNGSFVSGNEKILEMHLRDETLAHRVDRGLTLKSTFDVKPGSYLVRLVVRDTEGLLSAENGAIEIP